jgi:hypothetical protein
MHSWVLCGRLLLRIWVACVLIPAAILLASWVVRHGHSRWRETGARTRARTAHRREWHALGWREGHTARRWERHALGW